MAYYNPPYTKEEETKIVNYIQEKDVIDRVKGDAIWKSMEKDKITKRTWQSMKQHYRKTMAWQLNRSHYKLDRDTLRRFYIANNSITKRQNTGRKRAPVDPTRKYPDFSNLSFSSSSESDDEVRPVIVRDRSTEIDLFESEPERRISTDEEPPTNANAVLRITPSKQKLGRLILDSSSDTESDLGEHGTAGETPVVFIDLADETNDSVIEITNECVVINDSEVQPSL